MMEIFRDIEDKNLPVFARKSFLASRSDAYGWFRDGDLLLPFIIDKRFIFKRLIFTTGIIDVTGKLDTTLEKDFLNSAMALGKKELDVDMVAKAQANAVFNAAPDKSIRAPWGTYVKNIQHSDEELMLAIKSKTRNMVRRAQKGGVIVQKATVQELFELMHSTFKRQGEELLAPSFEYLQKLATNLKDNFLIIKAVKDDEIQGVAGIPYDDEKAYYLFGGSLARPYAGSLNLLQFEAMKILRDKGVSGYDFVGARIDPDPNSKYYKIQKFKTAFDPELQEGYAFKVIYKPLKYWLLNCGLRAYMMIKGKKYLGDPIDQIIKATQ